MAEEDPRVDEQIDNNAQDQFRARRRPPRQASDTDPAQVGISPDAQDCLPLLLDIDPCTQLFPPRSFNFCTTS